MDRDLLLTQFQRESERNQEFKQYIEEFDNKHTN